jgi:hypothetical protein
MPINHGLLAAPAGGALTLVAASSDHLCFAYPIYRLCAVRGMCVHGRHE